MHYFKYIKKFVIYGDNFPCWVFFSSFFPASSPSVYQSMAPPKGEICAWIILIPFTSSKWLYLWIGLSFQWGLPLSMDMTANFSMQFSKLWSLMKFYMLFGIDQHLNIWVHLKVDFPLWGFNFSNQYLILVNNQNIDHVHILFLLIVARKTTPKQTDRL